MWNHYAYRCPIKINDIKDHYEVLTTFLYLVRSIKYILIFTKDTIIKSKITSQLLYPRHTSTMYDIVHIIIDKLITRKLFLEYLVRIPMAVIIYNNNNIKLLLLILLSTCNLIAPAFSLLPFVENESISC
jgi:hypothetical protein